jgi:MYXO-CTERM domain-containing protein
MDLTGATLNAVLNNMTVGYHTSIPTSAGSGTGELTFEAGTISATTVIVGGGGSTGRGIGTINMNGGSLTAGNITLGAGNANTSGTFKLAGGTLSAGSIVQGVAGSTAAFNWTDGRLHVGQFGSSALPLDLLQQGGTLAPGNSIGTTDIFGDYTQLEAGVLEIEIAGPANHDFVMVHGDASLYGTVHVLMDGYEAQLRESFDVLQTTGDLTLGSLGIIGDLPNPTFGWWQAASVLGPGGEGAFLRLTVVPEPTSALLALLAIAALLGRRRRR